MKDESFLTMAINNLEFKLKILKKMRESKPINDKEDAMIVSTMIRDINKGNEKLIDILDEYIMYN